MGGVREGLARETLHDLARKELVRTVRTSSVHDQAEYSFWHALVRDVAYGQIPRAERAAKHLAVAAWIESTVGERISDQAEFLAYHYEHALQLSTAAGRNPGDELRARTARALRMAGERAQRLDVAKALDFYRRAEALLPLDDPEFPMLHVKTLAAAGDLGEGSGTEMAAAYEAAIEHLRRRGDVVGAGAMLREYGAFLKTVGLTERAERVTGEAVALLEPLGPSRELAAAYSTTAGNHMMAGRFTEWVTWTQAALDLADRLDLPEYRMRALQYRGIHRVISGDLEGRGDLEESLRIGLELGLGTETAVAYINLADWVSSLDGTAASLVLTEEGIRFAARRGLGSNGMWLRAESTWRLFDLGRWDDVIERSAEIRRWHGDRGWAQPVVIAGTQEAAVRLFRGELDAAAEQMDELLPAAREIKDVQTYRPALATAGLVALRRGRPEDAGALLDELEVDLDSGTYDRVYGMLEATRLARALGDVDHAERIARVNADFVPAYPVGQAIMLASRAEVSEAKGEHAEALAAFDSVAEAWDGLGHVFQRALALLGAARCLIALGRPPDALSRALAARAIFDSLGAGWLAAEAAMLVAEAPGRDSG
jgi:tetratricopeptide (TPR) repeat protein